MQNRRLNIIVFLMLILLQPPNAISQSASSEAQVAVLQERLEESIRINLASALRLRDFKEWDLAAKNLDLAFESLATLSRSKILEGKSASLIQQLSEFTSISLPDSQLTSMIEEIYQNSTNGYDFSASNRNDFEASQQLAVAIDFFRFYYTNDDTFSARSELENAVEIAEQLSQSENEFYATLGTGILDSLRSKLSLILPDESEEETVEPREILPTTAFSNLYWELVRPAVYDFDFDLENIQVKRQIEILTSERKDELNKWLARITRYLPEQRKIFNNNKLPQDIIFLSVIESGLNPRANSRKAAKGLWQFIYSTGRLYNLQRTLWHDDRYDPTVAGHAAAQHLRDLYAEFKSWELAIAAYNSGAGRISSAIRKAKSRSFWDIQRYVPRETRDYLPLFYAVLMIVKEPHKYGIEQISHLKPFEYDLAILPRPTDLKILAKCANASVLELRQLNPSLLRHSTPPVKAFNLRIPVGSTEKFQHAYAKLKMFQEQPLYAIHRVRKGENLFKIARKYGISQQTLLTMNNLNNPNRIYIGQRLKIPKSK